MGDRVGRGRGSRWDGEGSRVRECCSMELDGVREG